MKRLAVPWLPGYDLLLWRAIEWSVQRKDFRNFNMAAAHTFLRRFGGHAHATYRYSLDLTAAATAI
jgi:hypothetical protein